MMETSSRVAIPEDLEFDPTYARQRKLAAYLLGIAINGLRGSRPCWEDAPDKIALAKQLQDMALENGIVSFDEWHHAPACRANNWSRMHLPTGPCTCGAAKHKIR
jgi:hypothetical protein